MLTFIVLFIFLNEIRGLYCREQVQCKIVESISTNPFQGLTESTLSEVYTCPRDDDLDTYTKCCKNGECCESTVFSILPNEDCLLMITAILVISMCLCLTVLAVVCCFWSKCPLYSTCKPNYTTSNVIAYSLSKEDPMPLMPGEGLKEAQYQHFTVKIKKVQDV